MHHSDVVMMCKTFPAAVLLLLSYTLVGSGPGAAPATITNVPNPTEIRIGVVYPLTGRLESWGQQGLPFIRMAEADINTLPGATATGVRFRVIVRSDETTAAGARSAVRDLVENEGVKVIAGMPLSGLLAETASYLIQNHVAVISSASTSPLAILSQPDSIYRLFPPELYLARMFARLALELGYRKAVVMHRVDSGWGKAYASRFSEVFQTQGEATLIPFRETHPEVGDYAAEVAQLSAQVARLGADRETLIFLVAWEGEDLNILHHASRYPTLSRVRWLSAVLYPSLLNGCFNPRTCFPEVPTFALTHELWGQEVRITINELVRRLWSQAKTELGREPHWEHLFLYDALQLAARAVLLARTDDGDAVAGAIRGAAAEYDAATGIIRFDANGDRAASDLAYYGLFRGEQGWEFRYYAYYEAGADRFQILPQPAPRLGQFCPEC